MITAGELLDRLKLTKGLRTDIELAAMLEVPNSTLNGWRNRNAIGALIRRLDEKKIVLSGEGNLLGRDAGGDQEIQKLLQAALTLGSPEEVKALLQKYISGKVSNG